MKPNTKQPVVAEAQVCTKCGHRNVSDAPKGTSIYGMCIEPVKESAQYPPNMVACGCKCEFPAPQVEGTQIDPVNTYLTVIEAVQLLEAAGFGAVGKPNTLLAMVKEAIAAATPQSTPADEEVARELVDEVYNHYVTAYRGEEERRMFIARITAALARRAGTPTTDARERAKGVLKWMEQNAYLNVQWIMKSARKEDKYADELFALAKVRNEIIDRIAALSSTPSVDDYVAWCRYVNHGTDDSGADILTIEICDSDAKDAFKVYRSTSSEQSCKQCGCTHATAYELGRQDEQSATPSDEVAQRARAAALEEAARIVEQPFTGIAHTEQERWRIRLVNDLARQIRALKHFTATDVERTCTWACEPAPDIEMWETDCGNTFQFEADGPTENKMKFCCYCGKRLAEKVAEGREEGEGDG